MCAEDGSTGPQFPDTNLFLPGDANGDQYRAPYGNLVSLISFDIHDRHRCVEREDPPGPCPTLVLIEQGVRYFISLQMAESLNSPAAPILRCLRPPVELSLDGYGGLALIASSRGPQVELRVPLWRDDQYVEVCDTGTGPPLRVARLVDNIWTQLDQS